MAAPVSQDARPVSLDVKKLLAFGSGIGIEVGAADLEAAAVRVRPSRILVAGRAGLLYSAVGIGVTLALGLTLGRLLRVERLSAALISAQAVRRAVGKEQLSGPRREP